MNYEGFMDGLVELKGADWTIEEGGEIRRGSDDIFTACDGECPVSATANARAGFSRYRTTDWELAGAYLGMHHLEVRSIVLAADDDADADISTRADLLDALGLMERPI